MEAYLQDGFVINLWAMISFTPSVHIMRRSLLKFPKVTEETRMRTVAFDRIHKKTTDESDSYHWVIAGEYQ